ncbi:MAG: serine/threonine protein kinase [Amphiamblys sp. WSBS2006]|nr:MAG: serine/threonine protein kinase [Amphiamblys sp. WSBS2006]
MKKKLIFLYFSTFKKQERDFALLETISHTHSSRVTKIKNIKTAEVYVLKETRIAERGKQERRALKKLEHRNIVKVLFTGHLKVDREVRSGTVMEYGHTSLYNAIINEKLQDKIKEKRKEKRKEILLQILEAVSYIHSKEVAHGSLVAKNILIDPEGMAVKICGFGDSVCRDGPDSTPEEMEEGYAKDVLSVGRLMVFICIGERILKNGFLCLVKEKQLKELLCSQNPRNASLGGNNMADAYMKLEDEVGKDGIDLIGGLYKVGRKERIGFAEVMAHPFFHRNKRAKTAGQLGARPVRRQNE